MIIAQPSTHIAKNQNQKNKKGANKGGRQESRKYGVGQKDGIIGNKMNDNFGNMTLEDKGASNAFTMDDPMVNKDPLGGSQLNIIGDTPMAATTLQEEDICATCN